jgi:hypothetical protein
MACRERMTTGRVHKLRKQARHLQVRLELSCVLLDGAAVRQAFQKVTAHLHLLGHLRDTQVQLKRLHSLASGIQGMDPLLENLKDRRNRLANAAIEHLKAPKVDRRLRAVERQLRAMRKSATVEHHRRARLGRVFRAARQRAVAARRRAGTGRAGLHRARIALKRLILMDEVAQSLGRTAGPRKRAKRELQILGEIHDLDVLLARVDKCARRKIVAAETAEALGWLLAPLRAELLAGLPPKRA